MEVLYNKIRNGILEPEPGEGYGIFLCGRAALFFPPVLDRKQLSEETKSALEELGAVLKCIRIRMLSEGYELRDGIIRKAIS